MIQYLIQVVAFQLLFLVAYDLFLKKETFFQWNRVYLIFSSLVSFIIPFIEIESFQKAVPQEYIILLPEVVLTPQKAVEVIAPSWNWYLIIGIVVSSLVFIYKIVQLIQLKLKGIIVHQGSYKIIKIPNSSVAFSIFKYVFIGNEIEEEKLQDILSHELVHIRENHSLDLLYFEVLRILCWFNPLVYIYQKRISEVHEYIADASVAKENNKSDYYEKLLAEVFQTQHFSFTNQFFKHSLIKKRIIMLTKQKSRQILKLKYLILVPVLIFSLFYTSNAANMTAMEYTIESVDPGDKDAKLKKLYERFNELNRNLKDDEYFTRAQYEEIVELLSEISKLVAEDGELANEYKVQSYEEYLKVRKKRIAEGNSSNDFEQDFFEFKDLDKAPVFPGCESEGTLEGLKNCFILSIQKHVNANFNTKKATTLGLKGRQEIIAKFYIDTNGEIINVNVRAPHTELKVETERVLHSLPKLTPAMKDGKAVSVKYVLPIVFQIAE